MKSMTRNTCPAGGVCAGNVLTFDTQPILGGAVSTCVSVSS